MHSGKSSFFIGVENKISAYIFIQVLYNYPFSLLFKKLIQEKIFSFKDKLERSGLAGHKTAGYLVLGPMFNPSLSGILLRGEFQKCSTDLGSPHPCVW